MNYIEQQKKEIYALNLSESELKINLSKDRSRCCRLAKSKCGNMSDSMESLDSVASKRSHGSATKKPIKHSATPSPQQMNAAKRAKTNDEVVCTPDLLSMLEPDCQITVSPKPNRPMTTPSASTPKIMSIQQPQAGYGSMSSAPPKSSAPPPLVLRNTAIKLRPAAPPPVVRRTIIGPRTPNPGGNGTPVYHTINGYRIDLNSAAQQETFRLPNGKLIQVKRQGPPTPQNALPSANNWQRMSSPQPQRVIPQTIASRPVQITPHPYNISVQQQPGQHPQVVRYHNSMIGSSTINPVNHNGTTIQVLNGQMTSAPQPPPQQQQQVQQSGPIRPVMVRHVFPDNPIGQARNGLQDQVFNAMEICTHLTNKVQTLTNSNAYKQARNFLEVKELYIHLSYLLTYAIGRFKSLQDKCLGDMRTLGFGNDADCLENGQLAADKQASDDEDNEIEIVEPKTDLITLDSDDDEPIASSPIKTLHTIAQMKTQQQAYSSPQHSVDVKIKHRLAPASMAQMSRPVVAKTIAPQGEDNMDLMSMAQSFLASMLEVDIHEGPLNSPGSDSSAQKKQPRKKLTNKPNPTLLKQKALMELERLEEMKRNDQKLKMKCAVELKKAEEVYPYAKEMLEAKVKEKQQYEEAKKNKLEQQDKELKDETDKVTVEVIMDDDAMNSSTEENNKTENNDAIKTIATTIEKEEATVEITEKNNAKTEEKEEGNTTEKESSMETSENDTSVEIIHEIKDKSTENIAKNEIPTESTQKETAEDIIEKIEDKSTEYIQQKEEEPQKVEDKEAEIKSIEHADGDDDKKGNPNTIETGAILETIENSKNNDTEENKTNADTNEDKLQEDMEIDEKPPNTPTQDEFMDNDDKAQESPQTSLTKDDIETNNTKPDEKLNIDQEMDMVSPPQEDDNDKNIDKEKENEKVLSQEADNNEDKDKDIKESVEIGNENELKSPIKETLASPKNSEVKQPSTKPTITSTSTETESDKETVKDLTNSEVTVKTSPSAAEDLPSKKQTIETPATEIEATTTSSNGNV